MATATILDLNNKKIQISTIDNTVLKIKDVSYPQIEIKSPTPFKVRFTSIQIEGYTSTNVPPIPLQVIGFSNYIL